MSSLETWLKSDSMAQLEITSTEKSKVSEDGFESWTSELQGKGQYLASYLHHP